MPLISLKPIKEKSLESALLSNYADSMASANDISLFQSIVQFLCAGSCLAGAIVFVSLGSLSDVHEDDKVLGAALMIGSGCIAFVVFLLVICHSTKDHQTLSCVYTKI